MNRLLFSLVLVLFGTTVWLALQQRELSKQVNAVQAENARLNDALALKPDLTREEFAAATKRLEDAGAYMKAIEGRLSNASMLLTQLQATAVAASPAARFGPRPAGRSGRSAVRMVEVEQEGSLALTTSFEPARPPGPASSHSPTGERLSRSWGPEQVLGPPDTHEAGDYPTAWAPQSSQGGKDEWLQVNYENAVEVAEVRVHETHNPGAIARVVAILPGGGEVVLWEGATPPARAPVDTAFPVTGLTGPRAQSVKIYFDRTRAPGWNEIDAVELVGRDGSRQWGNSASASSTYAR